MNANNIVAKIANIDADAYIRKVGRMTLRELADAVIGEESVIHVEASESLTDGVRLVVRFPGSDLIHAGAAAMSREQAEERLRCNLQVEALRAAQIIFA